MRLLAALLLTFAGAVWAQGAAPPSAEERQRLEERRNTLREQARAIRDEAEETLKAEKDACWKKFLVTRCQEQARLRRVDKVNEARRIEQEARDIERDLRRREAEARAARWADTPAPASGEPAGTPAPSPAPLSPAPADGR